LEQSLNVADVGETDPSTSCAQDALRCAQWLLAFHHALTQQVAISEHGLRTADRQALAKRALAA
jgi:hypothetical protein